jgi:hypothetical protein
MTTTNTKPRTGDIALAYLIAPGRSSKTVMDAALADLRALIAERDDAVLLANEQGRRHCERLEALLADAAKSLAEAIDGHDSREEGSGYKPATGPWRASLRDIKAALAGEGTK